MTLLERMHGRFVAARRARRLSEHIATVIPPGPQRLLDVGCGDGLVARLVQAHRPDIHIHGTDLQAPRSTRIPMDVYRGGTLPYASGEFDVACVIDVLHHADDPTILLGEAARVARRAIIIKDHLEEGLWAVHRLRFMDRIGNRRFGISLPFNYWCRGQWHEAFKCLQLEPDVWKESLGLYIWPLRTVFDSTLHFLARCPLPPGEAIRLPAGTCPSQSSHGDSS